MAISAKTTLRLEVKDWNSFWMEIAFLRYLKNVQVDPFDKREANEFQRKKGKLVPLILFSRIKSVRLSLRSLTGIRG